MTPPNHNPREVARYIPQAEATPLALPKRFVTLPVHSATSRLRWLVVVPVVCALGILFIVTTTTWHALSVVRPPRAHLDARDIERELPGSEQVSFVGADGVLLAGTLAPPRNGAVIVLVHGLFSNRSQLLPEAKVLAAHGYGVLIYDNRAHGESGGTTATWGLREGEDARRAVDFVQQQTHVPDGKIGLFGFSIGGTAVLREASGDSRIGAVVVESTYTSMAGEIEYMFSRYGPISKLAARWTAQLVGGLDYSQLEPEQLVCSLKPRPLLLVYGTGDFDVRASEADRMAAAACDPSSLLMIDADTHGRFMAANANMYSQRLLAFFDAALV